MGFDGIRLFSSLHKGGVNPEDCEAVASELVEIEDIKIEIKRPYF